MSSEGGRRDYRAKTVPANVLVLFGTRPEAVKLAPVITRLRRHPALTPVVCVTGQHRELLTQVLDTFQIQPDSSYDLLAGGQPLAGQFSRALLDISRELEQRRPGLVVVQGDTASAAAGALAAFYAGVPVAHVEAGLRSGRMDDPFPEEGNRKVISAVASLHFAPTIIARDNLLHEGIEPDRIHVTGNTVIDALYGLRSSANLPAPPEWLPPDAGRLVLVTLHRRENWGARMAAICRGLQRALDAIPDAHLVFPMHPNPVVRRDVQAILAAHPRAQLVDPLEYPAFIGLLCRCTLVVTDSGGLQEEAPALGIPVLVAREATERPEAIAAGAARLVGADEQRVATAIVDVLATNNMAAVSARAANPFGDGHAAERIVAHIAGWFGLATEEDAQTLARPWPTVDH